MFRFRAYRPVLFAPTRDLIANIKVALTQLKCSVPDRGKALEENPSIYESAREPEPWEILVPIPSPINVRTPKTKYPPPPKPMRRYKVVNYVKRQSGPRKT